MLKNSGIYTLCNFLIKGLNFILLPIYTMYLTTVDYGITGLMNNFQSVLIIFCSFSLPMAVTRFYFDYRNDAENVKRYVGTMYCFTFLSSLLYCMVIGALQSWIMPLFFEGVDFMPTMLVTMVGMVFTGLYGIYQQLLRSMERAALSAITSIAYFILSVALTCLFIIPLSMGANGVLLATAISGFVFVVVSIFDLVRKSMFKLCIDLEILRGMLAYSIPLMPHNLSTHVATLVSGVLLNGTGSLAAVGLYNVASKFGVVADILQSSMSSAYQPWLFRKLEERETSYKEQIASFTEMMLWIFAAIFVLLGLFIQEIVLLFLDSSYAEAWPLIPLIVGVYSIKTVYYFYIGVLFYYKKASKFIFIATLSSSLLNVALSFVFIPWWGAYGSVLADAISMLLRVGIIIYMSKKCEDVGYRVWRFVRVTATIVVVLGIGLVFSYSRFTYELSLTNFLWKCFVFALFIALVCITHKRFVGELRGLLKSKLRRRKNL